MNGMNNKTTIEKITNELLGEHYERIMHKSGLEIVVIHKQCTSKYAVIGTRFGSADNAFIADGDKEYTVLPDGVAHFLEHKMFAEPDGTDALERFAAVGGDSNAFTSFGKTAYNFSCTESFALNLEILLDFVTHPYFTSENVAKEQGIIGEEIRMYDDSPGWQVYFNMLRGMYHVLPINRDIAGTIESIAEITPELLYKCYDCFYDLSNMLLVVSGDIDTAEVLDVADRVLPCKESKKVQKMLYDEPKEAVTERISCEMEVARPLFSFGIKESPARKSGLLEEAAYELLLHMMFDGSSDFYAKHYESGLISSDFSADFMRDEQCFFADFSGESDDPDAVAEAIKAEIAYRRQNFFDKKEFERAKNGLYAAALFDYDSPRAMADQYMTHDFTSHSDFFDYPKAIASLEYDYVKQMLFERFDTKNSSLSVVMPIK